MVSASTRMFGRTECPDSPDEEMNMWMVYRCDGGKDTSRLTGAKRCKIGDTTPEPITPRVVTATSNSCTSKEGSEVEQKVPGCGGRLDLNCINGCLRITKAQYTCAQDNSYTDDQLTKVQGLCEGKSKCKVPANRKVFGDSKVKGLCEGKSKCKVPAN